MRKDETSTLLPSDQSVIVFDNATRNLYSSGTKRRLAYLGQMGPVCPSDLTILYIPLSNDVDKASVNVSPNLIYVSNFR